MVPNEVLSECWSNHKVNPFCSPVLIFLISSPEADVGFESVCMLCTSSEYVLFLSADSALKAQHIPEDKNCIK